MQFYPLEKLINLHDGYRRGFKLGQHQLLLAQEEGRLIATQAQCPHRGQSLGQARISAQTIQCPFHGYQFSTENGALLHASAEPCSALKIYELVYEGLGVGIYL